MDNQYRYEYVKLTVRQCQYPGCTEYYQGKGFSKYCATHRAREYRKVIDRVNKKPVIKENPNQIYKHELVEAKIIIFQCAACSLDFEIKVYPGIYIYPKYCEEHRNEWRRQLYLNLQPVIIVPEETPVIIYNDYEAEYEDDREIVNGVLIE